MSNLASEFCHWPYIWSLWFAFKNSVGKVFTNETDIENLNKIIGDGNLAEHKVTKYDDTLKYNLWLLAYKALPPYRIMKNITMKLDDQGLDSFINNNHEN